MKTLIKIKNIKKAVVLFVLFVLALLSYAYFIEPNSIKIERQDLDLDCIENKKTDYNFVQISDLHFTGETEEKTLLKISKLVAEQKPSAIFLTGDLIANESGASNAVKFSSMLTTDFPLYIVFGNWDYWSMDFDLGDFRKNLESAGAIVLVNSNRKISLGGDSYYILGVKDPYTSGDNEQDLEKSLSNTSNDPKGCKILLAHSPNVIKYAKNKDIDLILVGHTHGGQVYIPLVSEYLIPTRREAGRGFVSGLYTIGEDKMYVNRGLGTSLLPLRFLAPPEITVIKIN